ncbi:hypothetical protein K2X92_01065 [Candidatus Gracilibacteria bacterium]|nr:hypothetical protein [Candidatus Gracilibacteria bacterium]
MNLDITHLVWTTVLSLVVSHFGANYLVHNTPKGYWFWFTFISIGMSLLFW